MQPYLPRVDNGSSFSFLQVVKSKVKARKPSWASAESSFISWLQMGWEKAFPGQFIPAAPELPAEASQMANDQESTSRKGARGRWIMREARSCAEFSSQLVGEAARHVVRVFNPRTQKAEAKEFPRVGG